MVHVTCILIGEVLITFNCMTLELHPMCVCVCVGGGHARICV